MKTKVLLVGLATAAVDFEKWPELTPEKLECAFKSVLKAMDEEGFDSRWCLISEGEAALAAVEKELREGSFDVVVIGAGVRADPDHLHLFERLVNAMLRLAPGSRIAFNTLPFDTVEAVKRALEF